MKNKLVSAMLCVFGCLYDKATHHCNTCGWDGDCWELKGDTCPKCQSKDITELGINED